MTHSTRSRVRSFSPPLHFQEIKAANDPLLPSATSFLLIGSSSNPTPAASKQSIQKVMEVPQGHEAAALRTAAQNKPPANARPWPRGSGGASAAAAAAAAPPPPPPKVYRVEPREFRDLVQRLTGAPPTALRRPQHQHQHQHHRAGVAAPSPVQPQPVRPAGGGGEQPVYGAPAPWFSFPMAGAVEAAAAQPQHGAFL